MTEEMKNKIASLYNSEKKRALGYIFNKKMARDLNEAENLIHDAICSMLESKTITDNNLKGYLYISIYNGFVNRYRKEVQIQGALVPRVKEFSLDYIPEEIYEDDFPLDAEQCVKLLHPIKDKQAIRSINLKLTGLQFNEFNDGLNPVTHRTRYHFGVKKIKAKLNIK